MIVGRRLAVRTVERLHHEGEPVSGLCTLDGNLIQIDASLRGDVLRSTVLHECIHGVADTLGYGWKEKQVEQAEAIFFLLMRSNPELVRWVMREDDDNGSTPTEERGNTGDR